MSRCVIVGGAEIRNYDAVRKYLAPGDWCIYCDCGLNHQEALGHAPDLVIGDFDSHTKPNGDNVIVLPVVKDDTDTIFAVKEALRRGYDDILLVGVVGGRMDHTLGNIYALLMIAEHGAKGRIIDDCSEIELICAGELKHIGKGFRFFSLLNITGTARGITISGAKYNLDDAQITSEYQYGISNEVAGDEAVISLKEGNLLLVCVV